MAFVEELSATPPPIPATPPLHADAVRAIPPLTPDSPSPSSAKALQAVPRREETPCPQVAPRNASAGPSRLTPPVSVTPPPWDPSPWLVDDRLPERTERIWKAIRVLGGVHADKGGFLPVKDWLEGKGFFNVPEALVGDVVGWFKEKERRDDLDQQLQHDEDDDAPAGNQVNPRPSRKRAASSDLEDEPQRNRVKRDESPFHHDARRMTEQVDAIDLTGDSDDDETKSEAPSSDDEGTGRMPYTGQQHWIIVNALAEAGKTVLRDPRFDHFPGNRNVAQFREMRERWVRQGHNKDLAYDGYKKKCSKDIVWPSMKPGPGSKWTRENFCEMWLAVLDAGAAQKGIWEEIVAKINRIGPARTPSQCSKAFRDTIRPHFGGGKRRR